MLAEYTDYVLGGTRKTWVEFHLARCVRCRVLVTEALKAQRETELPSPPAELQRKAFGFVERRRVPKRWVWAPAGALVGCSLLLVALIALRKPQQLVLSGPPSPSAPLIGKFEPPVVPRHRVSEIERKDIAPESVPTIVSPQAGSVISREQLQFGWKPIVHSRYYQVRMVTLLGDLVWEAKTEKHALQPPSDLHVKDGTYFVWIEVHLADGRVAKSKPVRFAVNR
jgi:hypothetical protein